MAVDNVKG